MCCSCSTEQVDSMEKAVELTTGQVWTFTEFGIELFDNVAQYEAKYSTFK